MRHHRIAARLAAILLLTASPLVGFAVATTRAATPPPPLLAVTTGPPPPGFCDVTFCFVFHTGGFALAGALQAPPLSVPPPPF